MINLEKAPPKIPDTHLFGVRGQTTQCISIFALPKIMHVMPHAFSHQSSDHTLLITGAKMQPFTSSGYMPFALPVSSTQIPPPTKCATYMGPHIQVDIVEMTSVQIETDGSAMDIETAEAQNGSSCLKA